MVWRGYLGLGLRILFLERVCIWRVLVAGNIGGCDWFGFVEPEVGEAVMGVNGDCLSKKLQG